MAQGDSFIFYDFELKRGQGNYNLGTDGFSIAFVADTFASLNQSATNPNISGFTPLSGGNFAASTNLGSLTWGRTGSVSTFDYANLATILKDAANPTTIRVALIKHTTSGDLYKAVDLTTDGSTAIDVVNNDFDYTVSASGSMTTTVV
jgi:hypothetical protein